MTVTATDVFDFLDGRPVFTIEKYEMSLVEFSDLRRRLRSIIVGLKEGESQDAQAASDRLRTLLSEWLTVPVPFDGAIREEVETLGNSDAVESRWGRDVRAWYDAAKRAADGLSARGNPVRDKLRDLIREFRTQGRTFRIYCRRRDASQFASIFDPTVETALEERDFLHSVRDYRDSELFDVLIKVGPLRSKGWGSVPDSIMTAPRFTTLVQVVWSGCGDEEDFGYDPVAASAGGRVREGDGAITAGLSWKTQVARSGDPPGTGGIGDADEFLLFRELRQVPDRRRATLVQIDEEHGILYPPHSQVLSFDPDPETDEPLGRRLPGETLVEGMFVVRQSLLNVDLGGVRASRGSYSRIWQARLALECEKDLAGLVERLRNAGLDLIHLRGALAHWCKAPTTVIHAPQQARHLQILIQVLGIDFDQTASASHQRAWWLYAWEEIARSRGEAIQAGFQGQEIIEEELCSILTTNMLPHIRQEAADRSEFAVPLPADRGLQGSVAFNRVCSIDEGFLAPDSELGVVSDLDSIEQWRV